MGIFTLQILRKWKYSLIWNVLPLCGIFTFFTWEPLETESIPLSGIFAFIWDFRLFHLWTVSKGIRGDRTGEQMSRTHQPSMDQKDFLQLFTEFFESSPNIFQLFINYLNFYAFLRYLPPTSENSHRNIFLPNSRGKKCSKTTFLIKKVVSEIRWTRAKFVRSIPPLSRGRCLAHH